MLDLSLDISHLRRLRLQRLRIRRLRIRRLRIRRLRIRRLRIRIRIRRLCIRRLRIRRLLDLSHLRLIQFLLLDTLPRAKTALLIAGNPARSIWAKPSYALFGASVLAPHSLLLAVCC